MPVAVPFCPRCFASLQGSPCPTCGLGFVQRGALLDVLGEKERERAAGDVEAFYTQSPFPGYAPGDDGALLIDRCRSAPFLVALDAALPLDARVLDVGCGTGQVPAFLALSGPDRRIVGVDGCRASLTLAEEFRSRARLENLQLVRADLFDLPIEAGSFPFVSSRGVVHHTPDPRRAVECVARCVAPGGTRLLGFYETRARAFHVARRALSRLLGSPSRALDPVLARRDLDEEKKRIWIEDQYRHPLEHILPLPSVIGWLRALGFRWVRSVPPAPAGESLFEAGAPPGPLELALLRFGWLLAGVRDPDAGLVCVVARRQERV